MKKGVGTDGLLHLHLDSHEVESTLCGQGPSNHGLAATWGAVEEHPPGRPDAHLSICLE